MKKMMFILSLLVATELFAQKIEPQQLYYKVLERNVEAVDGLLQESIDFNTLGTNQIKSALEFVATYWCKDEKVDVALIKELTTVFSKANNAVEQDKVKLIGNTILPLFQYYALDPDLKEGQAKLAAMAEVLVPQIEIFKLGEYLYDMLGDGLISSAQLKTAILSMLYKGSLETKSSYIKDCMTKAKSLNDKFMTGTDKSEITAKIGAVEADILKKDQELLRNRIKQYSLIAVHTTYEYDIQLMLYRIFSIKGKETDVDNREKFSVIILGTPERDFQDGLLARVGDISNPSPVIGDLVALLFLTANETVQYQGEEYTPSTLLDVLFSYNSLYNSSFLNSIYSARNLPETYSFTTIDRREFTIKTILPKDAFKSFKKLMTGRMITK